MTGSALEVPSITSGLVLFSLSSCPVHHIQVLPHFTFMVTSALVPTVIQLTPLLSYFPQIPGGNHFIDFFLNLSHTDLFSLIILIITHVHFWNTTSASEIPNVLMFKDFSGCPTVPLFLGLHSCLRVCCVLLMDVMTLEHSRNFMCK